MITEYPKISIITPSYNQGAYIEETILSVLDQKYPKVEYIIVDGGSTDNTIDIIKKYKKYINYWVSEKDNGQSCAINKGLKYATGEIINWLNSDDYYMPGALHHVGSVFAKGNVTAYSGRSRVFSDSDEYLSQGTDIYPGNLIKTIGWARIDQPETFLHRRAWDALLKVNENFHYVMDKELWIRYLLNFGLDGIVKDDRVLVNFRVHKESKTGSQAQKFRQETFDLFYTIAQQRNLDVAPQLAGLIHTSAKEVFGYDHADKDLLEKSANYFLLHIALQAYAENNYQLAKKSASCVDRRFLEQQDLNTLERVLFRMKILPVKAKAFINKISKA